MTIASLHRSSDTSRGMGDRARDYWSETVPPSELAPLVATTAVVPSAHSAAAPAWITMAGHQSLRQTAMGQSAHDDVSESTLPAAGSHREKGAQSADAVTTAPHESAATERDVQRATVHDWARPVDTVVSAALSALRRVLAKPPDSEQWQACARRLRAVTAAERDRSRRHAAMALLLADALSFTQPEDLRDEDRARGALESGWRALAQPFVSGDVERQVTQALAAAGWHLSLPYRGWVASA
jgi:hypothetical protein